MTPAEKQKRDRAKIKRAGPKPQRREPELADSIAAAPDIEVLMPDGNGAPQPDSGEIHFLAAMAAMGDRLEQFYAALARRLAKIDRMISQCVSGE
ncbi:MAG: hypothetical protein AAAC47_29705 [Pararhizobium sp.]